MMKNLNPLYFIRQHPFSTLNIILSHNMIAEWHSHPCLQICLSPHNELITIEAESGAQKSYGFIIPPNLPHRLDTSSQCCINLLVDPADPNYHRLVHRTTSNSLTLLDYYSALMLVSLVQQALTTHVSLDLIQVERLLTPYPPCRCQTDKRIDRAVSLMNSLPVKCVSSKTISARIFLSESRFLHLFRDKMGINFRGYLLWQRFRDAVGNIDCDTTLTSLASDCGFSDCAHFSRTCMTTFGLRPSSLRQALHNNTLWKFKKTSNNCPVCRDNMHNTTAYSQQLVSTP
ncbi:AraC family transcriptional regulator [Brenneria rubrifaciens]|uniref:AraC family transcriptional regulator n=1 Tax=Brenneria rubrifaciens TaxID=55213 RepID=A0A4P8QS67_9GAMM|nr:helix-turn-helix transcriptional regulator [Brenneria rubrifaciens]QCR08379.1 AraC family transcriptional regulator [Brenneria rubrifaciens]